MAKKIHNDLSKVEHHIGNVDQYISWSLGGDKYKEKIKILLPWEDGARIW